MLCAVCVTLAPSHITLAFVYIYDGSHDLFSCLRYADTIDGRNGGRMARFVDWARTDGDLDPSSAKDPTSSSCVCVCVCVRLNGSGGTT